MSPVRFRTFVAVVAALTGAPGVAEAQGGTITVHGVAYDSLHAARLSGAFIALVGSSRTTTSDAQGNFQFDSITPGSHRFVMQHDVLDAIGMSGASANAVVTDGRDTIRISVPSLVTLWRVACHALPPPDSGIIFGTVRTVAGRKGQAGATVTGAWIDIGLDKKVLSQRRWHLDVETDSGGGYALCGVPLSTGVRLRATANSAATGLIDLEPLDEERIQRRDLVLGRPIASDSTARGVVVGLVTGDKGPLSNARVDADSVAEVRTGDDGRFILRGVPAGTQQIEVLALGLSPVTAVVDVIAHDTAHVDVHLGNKVTILDSVRVSAEAVARQRLVLGFLERKRTGLGYFRDSTTMGKFNTLSGIFTEMPGVIFHSGGLTPGRGGRGGAKGMVELLHGHCAAWVWVDRVRLVSPFDADFLRGLRPQDMAALEVYQTLDETPLEFQDAITRKPPGCGSIVIWTKRGWP